MIWDSTAAQWASYELVLVHSTWDYALRRDAFVDWAYSLPRVCNPAAVLAWNTDKRYLENLAAAGVPVVTTRFAGPDSAPALPPWPEYVIKPTVSAGSADTARWRLGADDDAALAHLQALRSAGRTAMVQPYLDAVDEAGESALIYLGGSFSHSVRKAPILTVGTPPTSLAIVGHDEREQIVPRTATAEELAVAERVLAAVPGGREQLVYARVDLLTGPGGTPVLLELELTEPALYLHADPAAADRLAAAVAVQLRR